MTTPEGAYAPQLESSPVAVDTGVMSMLASFVEVEPGLLDRILADPSLAEALFHPGPTTLPDAERMRAVVLAQAPQLLANAIDMHPALREEIEKRVGRTYEELRRGEGGEAVMELMQASAGRRGPGPIEGAHAALSLDKAWHGLHYVLSGSVELGASEPLVSQAVLGGAEIGDDFSGYGPARYFDAGRVGELAVALGDPRVEQDAAERFDPQRMTELQVYPFGWAAGDREWVMSALADLRSFYAGAAADGRCVATCLV
jgi:hypothetical protein